MSEGVRHAARRRSLAANVASFTPAELASSLQRLLRCGRLVASEPRERRAAADGFPLLAAAEFVVGGTYAAGDFPLLTAGVRADLEVAPARAAAPPRGLWLPSGARARDRQPLGLPTTCLSGSPR